MSELHEFRRAKDLSVITAARILGIPPSQLSDFEFHRAAPTERQIAAMATLYDVTPETIAAVIPTQEQIDTENAHHILLLEAVADLKADAKSKGFGVGNRGSSTLPCPVCRTGTIRYSVAGVNGHMMAACSTQGCKMRFME